MNNSQNPPNILGYWRGVFGDLIHWYDVADSKSMGIITINGILLSFIALGSVLSPEQNIFILSQEKSMIIFYLITSFIFSILVSVILSVISLWARIKLNLSFIPSELRSSPNKFDHVGKERKFTHPVTFFSYIADEYPADERNLEEQGNRYFNEQITKFTSEETLLRAMAVEITILSSNTNKKYQLINLSFVFVVISLALMSAIVLLTYAY